MGEEDWKSSLDERTQEQIEACIDYYQKHTKAGLPGHTLMILVAILSEKLDAAHKKLSQVPPIDIGVRELTACYGFRPVLEQVRKIQDER